VGKKGHPAKEKKESVGWRNKSGLEGEKGHLKRSKNGEESVQNGDKQESGGEGCTIQNSSSRRDEGVEESWKPSIAPHSAE